MNARALGQPQPKGYLWVTVQKRLCHMQASIMATLWTLVACNSLHFSILFLKRLIYITYSCNQFKSRETSHSEVMGWACVRMPTCSKPFCLCTDSHGEVDVGHEWLVGLHHFPPWCKHHLECYKILILADVLFVSSSTLVLCICMLLF